MAIEWSNCMKHNRVFEWTSYTLILHTTTTNVLSPFHYQLSIFEYAPKLNTVQSYISYKSAGLHFSDDVYHFYVVYTYTPNP